MAVEPGSAAVPWRSRTLQVVLACTAVLPLGVPLLSPALPVVRDAFAISDARASLLITAYFVPGVVLSPFIGALADRVGRRRVVVPSLLVFAGTGVAVAFQTDFAAVLALRLVQGTAAAGVFIVTVTLIGDTFEGVQRNAVLGVNAAVLFTSAAAYPFLGGTLAAYGWNAPFVAYLAGVPVALFALGALEERPRERPAGGLAYLRGALASLPATESAALYGTTLAMEALSFGAVLTALPFLLEGAYGVAPAAIGLLVTAVTVVSAAVAWMNGALARHLSDAWLISLGFACAGVSLLGAWLASSPLGIGIASLLFGAALGLVLPAVDAAISAVAPPAYRAGALSVRNGTSFLGRAIGPVLFAGAAAVIGYHVLLLAGGAFALACAVTFAGSMARGERAPIRSR